MTAGSRLPLASLLSAPRYRRKRCAWLPKRSRIGEGQGDRS